MSSRSSSVKSIATGSRWVIALQFGSARNVIQLPAGFYSVGSCAGPIAGPGNPIAPPPPMIEGPGRIAGGATPGGLTGATCAGTGSGRGDGPAGRGSAGGPSSGHVGPTGGSVREGRGPSVSWPGRKDL